MFRIFVDSGANIPAEDVKKYKIDVISFVNYVNGEELVNFNPDLTPEEERIQGKKYYDAVREGADIKTSLINTGNFLDHFTPVLEAGEDILYISLSKNISGTYNAAKLAAEDLREQFPERRIFLVDALNASLGQGIHAIYASEMRDKGMDVEEVAGIIEKTVPKMNGMFTVGDLKYLAHTGRIHQATAVVGNVLSIKPILRGNAEGYIVEFKKCRGRKKSLETLIDLVCDNILEPEKQIIGIAHADAYEESLYVMDKIQERVKVRGFLNTSYDYCTGSHVGPDTIALFFIANDRELGGRPKDSEYVMPDIFKYL
ncbi:MAG: DegV family protein [Lachnospiraceae bacterium]